MHDLNDLRTSLNNLDNAIVYLMAERFRLTKKVGEYKKAHNVRPIDPEREARQMERVAQLASEAGLDPAFAQQMLRLIIDEVVVQHKKLQGIE